MKKLEGWWAGQLLKFSLETRTGQGPHCSGSFSVALYRTRFFRCLPTWQKIYWAQHKADSSLCMGDLDIIFINAHHLDCFGWSGWLQGFSILPSLLHMFPFQNLSLCPREHFSTSRSGKVLSFHSLLKNYSLEKPLVHNDVGCKFTVYKAGKVWSMI